MIYKLYSDNVEQGLIQTAAPEDVVQNYWNQVYSDVYLFEERRHIESENSGVSGGKTVEELVILLKYRGYAETIRVYEGNKAIDIHSNKIDFV